MGILCIVLGPVRAAVEMPCAEPSGMWVPVCVLDSIMGTLCGTAEGIALWAIDGLIWVLEYVRGA